MTNNTHPAGSLASLVDVDKLAALGYTLEPAGMVEWIDKQLEQTDAASAEQG